MIRPAVLAGLTLFLSFGMAVCPEATAQNSPQPNTTFSSNSELVLVPVQVLDRMDQPLRGLKKQDFVLQSDSKSQRIGLFDEVHSQPGLINPNTAAKASQPIPALFSNVPADGLPRQLTIVALDMVNTTAFLQKWTLDQLVRYLQANPLQEPVALVEITPDGLRQFHEPTTDTAAIIAALQEIHPRIAPFDAQNPPLFRVSFDGSPGGYGIAMASIQQSEESRFLEGVQAISTSLRSFKEIAAAYSGIPGRKTVLWFTSGFPALEEEPDTPPLFGHPGPPHAVPSTSSRRFGGKLLPEFQQTFAELGRSNVVLYPVDVTGLPEDRLWGVWNALVGGNGLCGTRLEASIELRCSGDGGWLDRIGMKKMAAGTGGKSCTAGHSVRECLDQAKTESADYYLLGFYVPQPSRKAGWHDLRITVAGDHGDVRARAGYYLQPAGASSGKENRDIDGAIDAALEYTGIVFSVEPVAANTSQAERISFKVSVPASSIVLTSGQDKLSFDIVSVPLSDKGTPIPNAARISKLDMPHSAVQAALSRGWSLVDFVYGDRSVAAVKIVVRDNLSGATGSVVIPVAQASAGS